MDAERRRALIAKRAAAQASLKTAEGRATLQPALAEIEAAGTAYRIAAIDDNPQWLAPWVPEGYSSIPWSLLRPTIDRSFEGTPYDEDAKYTLVRDALAARALPDQSLRVMTGRLGLSLALTGAAVARHLRAILDTYGFETWIAPEHKPEWLIEASHAHVYVSDFASFRRSPRA